MIPTFTMGQNALVDFSPVTNALRQNQQNYLAQQNMDMARERMGMERDRLSMAQAAEGRAQKQFDADWFGQRAMAIANLPDGPQRSSAWQQFVAQHPDHSTLDPAHLDPRTGPQMVAAEYGKYRDQLEVAMKQAQIQHLRTSASNDTQRLELQKIETQLKQRELDNPAAKFTKIGQDAQGVEQYGFVDPRNMTVKPVGQSAGGIDPNKSTGLTGDAFLQTLPPEVAAEIRGYAEGRIPYSPTMARSPRGMAMTRLIEQYDPQFDAVNYAARARTRNDFASGKAAQNLTSFNTAIGHLDSLDKAIDPLGNTSVPMINAARNMVRGQMSGDYQVASKNFATAKNAVVEELTRAFKGTAGSLSEVHEWEKVLNAADSPQALHAAVKMGIDLLESRIESVGDQYNRGMGTTKQPLELLNPKARATLERLKGGKSSIAAPASTPVRVSSPDEARRLPSGTQIMLPDGSVGRVP